MNLVVPGSYTNSTGGRGAAEKKERGPVAKLFRRLAPTFAYEEDRMISGKTVTYRRLGEKHRVDGPAVTTFSSDGLPKREEWYVENERHREDGPAIVDYAPGYLATETYYSHNRISRIDGPARIFYRQTGEVDEQAWFLDGVTHRVGQPAVILFGANGLVAEERWYREGREHRIDGPSVVHHLAEKKFYRDRWNYDNRRVEGPGEIGRILLEEPPEIRHEEIATSSYGVLLTEGHTADEISRVLAEDVSTVDGIRQVLGGAPVEWVRSYEEAAT